MSEEKRTLETIQKEYNQNCAKAGQIQYQIKVLKAEMDAINDVLLNLNREAIELQKQGAPSEEPKA